MNKMEAQFPISLASAPTRLCGAFIRLDVDGRIKFVGPGADALLGMDITATVGELLIGAKWPDDMRRAFSELYEEMRRPADPELIGTREAEFQLRTSDGARQFLVSAFFEDAENLLFFTQDISAYVAAVSMQNESMLREEHWRQHADATARARDQFLSVVSHELRSPLNGIQSWAHVLESQIDTDRPIVQRALVGIKTGVTQQVFLIEALLDATQILTGQFQILQQPYSLNGAIQSALSELRTEAEQKQLDIVFTPDVADIDMVGDVERVQQVFRHLLSNAIKFTNDHGNVRIRVSRGTESAEVSVEDDGIGIAPIFGASIFEPFRQQDSSQTRRTAGLGLGLAVSHRVAELHGGSLNFESEGVGRGSTFRVVLPLAR